MEKFLINTLYGVKLSADYYLLKKRLILQMP